MRITTFLMLLGLLQVSAKSSAQLISLSGKNMPLMEVLKTIHQQSDYDFIFMVSAMDEAHPVNVDFRDLPLKEALAKVFADQPLGYAIEEGAVTVWMKKTHRGHTLTPNSTWSTGNKATPEGLVLAYAEVRGRVVDSLGRPLVGASVRVLNAAGKRTALQTKTDREGYFELKNVPEDAMLEVTFIGYEQRTVNASGTVENVVLQQATSTLDETIVQAYGTTTRRLNTGNIAKVSASEIERQPVTNPLAALQGRIPGMLVTQTNGLPGGAFNVQIRGRTAIDQNLTSDEPLFVIDGVPFGPGNESMYNGIPIAGASQSLAAVKAGVSPFNGINPQDIESIEVLKDADATAIYGSRGANGVVLITTKKAKEGSFSVTVNSNHGVSYIAKLVEMMNTQQYVAARKKAFENDGVEMTNANAYDVLLWDTTRNFNYAEMLAGGVASNHNTQIALNGGSKLTKFSLRGGYNWENTVLSKDHRSKRTNLSFNISQSSKNEKFLLNFAGNYTQSGNNLTSVDLSQFLNLPPHLNLYNDDGTLSWEEEGYTFTNPLAYFNSQTSSDGKTIYANFQPIYHINEDLKLSANLGYNITTNGQRRVHPSTAQSPNSTLPRTVNLGTTNSESWTLEPQVEYRKELWGGMVNALVGGTFQQAESRFQRINATDFPSDESMRSISNAPAYTATEGFSDYRYAAFFGRLNYNFRDTYLINVTGRRDGSSRFGPGKQFATFGALGAAWIFTNERIMDGIMPWMSFGKVRASFGTTGNDKIPDYQYLDTWAVVGFQKPEIGPAFLYPDKLFNPGYQWESTIKSEYALEFGLFNDRLMFSPVYFRNKSSNQLVNYQLPSITGFTGVVANLPATVINAGFELTLSSRNIEKANFSWRTDLNLSIPKNKLAAFPDIENSSYYTTYVVGQPLNVIYLLKYTGVNPENGEYTFEDLNQDGVLDTDDYQPLGNTDPKYYGGIQNSFRYKNFNLDVFILFRNTIGQNYKRHYRVNSYGGRNNLPVIKEKVWEQPGDIADVGRLSQQRGAGQYDFGYNSNGIYSDASFIRVNNVSLSYGLPKSVMEKWAISSLRVYALTQNLFTITAYEVGDPETQNFLSTPPLRTVTMGIQLTL